METPPPRTREKRHRKKKEKGKIIKIMLSTLFPSKIFQKKNEEEMIIIIIKNGGGGIQANINTGLYFSFSLLSLYLSICLFLALSIDLSKYVY